MKKYTKTMLNILKNVDNCRFEGVDDEIVFYFISSVNEDQFLALETIGITYPNSNYLVNRQNSNLFTIEYVVSGIGHLYINNKEYTCKTGDAYILLPNTKQEYYADKNNPFKKYWVNFRSKQFEKYIKDFNLENNVLYKNLDISNEMNSIFELEKITSENKVISNKAMSILFSILMKMKQYNELGSHNFIEDEIIIAKSIIDEDDTYDLSIDEICKRSFISKQTLFNKFKKAYNITPHQYILRKKIIVSCDMLLNQNLSIAEIAETLKFTDEYAFSHAFKKQLGITPSKYRKNRQI